MLRYEGECINLNNIAMNRNNAYNDRPRKNHYADFDEHGNARTGNTNSLSRFNPESSQRRSDRDRYENHDERGRMSHGTRAYGDFSGGTRYGEGGSTFGGGSAYGPSNYGISGRERPSHMGGDRNYYDHNEHSRQNYGHSGGYNYSGRMNDESGRGYRGTGNIDSNQSRSGYRNEDRGDRGYNHSFDEFRDTGYGSTRYNKRDEDRERSAYNNWGQNQQRRSEDERRYDERNRYRDNQD